MRFTQVSRADNGFGARSRQSANPLRTISIIAFVGLLFFGGLYVALSRTASRVTHRNDRIVTTVPRVSVLSARRAPNTLSVITRTGKVSRAFANFAADFPTQSCVAVEWMGIRLGAVNSTKALIPASSTKLIIASVALEILKPEFVYTTRVHGTLDANGSVADLFFVGGGDPLIVRNEYVASEKYPTTSGTSLEKLADSLVATGLKRVAGSVVGIDSRYDDKRFVDVWPQDFHYTEAGPLGALFVDDGVVLGLATKPDDPAVSAATELQNLLSARGVLFGALPRRDAMPTGTPEIASIQSAPLTSVIQEMMVNSDNNSAELLLKEIGFAATMIGATLQNTANPTMLEAGYKANVIPGSASAVVDGRFIPGFEDELNETIKSIIGEHVRVETITRDKALEVPFEGDLVEAMCNALIKEDAVAIPVPYVMSGGTDNKALADLGIIGYGFSPLKLDADFDFTAMFHGVDERVPIEGLTFGARVLKEFLENA